MKLNSVHSFDFINPEHVIIRVQNTLPVTNMLAQTTLRAMVGRHELELATYLVG